MKFFRGNNQDGWNQFLCFTVGLDLLHQVVMDEMVGLNERLTKNYGHLYGHQGGIVKSLILCKPLL